MAGLPLDHLTRAANRGRIGGALGEHVGDVADRGQRIAQFVRQHGEEFVLAAIGFTQRLRVAGGDGQRFALRPRAPLQLMHELTREQRDHHEEHHVRNPLGGRRVVRPVREPERGQQRREQAGEDRRPASAEIGGCIYPQHEWQQRRLCA